MSRKQDPPNDRRAIWLTVEETDLSDAQLYHLIKTRFAEGISADDMLRDYRFGDVKSVVSGVLYCLGAYGYDEAVKSRQGRN